MVEQSKRKGTNVSKILNIDERDCSITRRYEILEKNVKRKQIDPMSALQIIAMEIEEEANYLVRHDQALTASANNIRYAAAFIRAHFCVDDDQAVEADVLSMALRAR